MGLWNGCQRGSGQNCTNPWRVRFGHFVDADCKLNLAMPAFVRNRRKQLMLGAASAPLLLKHGFWIIETARTTISQPLHIGGELIEASQARPKHRLTQRTGWRNGEVQ